MKWTSLILAVALLTAVGCAPQVQQQAVESSHAYVALTDANFQSEVLDNDKPVLVDFYADWCSPCKAMSPIVEELAGDFADKAVVGKLNVDYAQDLAVEYGVQSIPTFIVFKNGQEVERKIGGGSKGQLAEMLAPHL